MRPTLDAAVSDAGRGRIDRFSRAKRRCLGRAQRVVERQKIVSAAMADQEFSMDELVSKGEAVYQANCAACHGPTGAGVPGAFPAMTGSAIINNPDPAAHIDNHTSHTHT